MTDTDFKGEGSLPVDELEKLLPHLPHLRPTVENMINLLYKKEQSYRGSWNKRGGVGAFMMLARKWDRIEAMAVEANYDIHAMIRNSDGDTEIEGAFADVTDLLGYLLLVMAHYRYAKMSEGPGDAPELPGSIEPLGYHERREVTPKSVTSQNDTGSGGPFGYHEEPKEEEVLDTHERKDLEPSNYDMNQFGNMKIPKGSMKGHIWGTLFEAHPSQPGRYRMKVDHAAEYGK